jgi:hypothetical protein
LQFSCLNNVATNIVLHSHDYNNISTHKSVRYYKVTRVYDKVRSSRIPPKPRHYSRGTSVLRTAMIRGGLCHNYNNMNHLFKSSNFSFTSLNELPSHWLPAVCHRCIGVTVLSYPKKKSRMNLRKLFFLLFPKQR